ncbi:hypothetical protein KAU39_05895 [bacterium]|nr:hypothetical protein [bacterium]
MRLEKDFEDFIKGLNKNKVKYCIVGAYAVVFHGLTRYTGDMDVFVESTLENSIKIRQALIDFEASISGLESNYFSKTGNFFQIGVPPVMIHILTKLGDTSFNEVWNNKIKTKYGSQKTYFIGINELIKVKQLANRAIDKEDLKYLLRVVQKKQD